MGSTSSKSSRTMGPRINMVMSTPMGLSHAHHNLAPQFANQMATESTISSQHLKECVVPNTCPKTVDPQNAVPLASSLLFLTTLWVCSTHAMFTFHPFLPPSPRLHPPLPYRFVGRWRLDDDDDDGESHVPHVRLNLLHLPHPSLLRLVHSTVARCSPRRKKCMGADPCISRETHTKEEYNPPQPSVTIASYPSDMESADP